MRCLKHMTLARLCEKNLWSNLLVLETRNGFFFGGIVDMWVSWIQIKYFIMSLPRNEKIWTRSVYQKEAIAHFFQIFPMTFKDYAKFLGYISLYVLFLMNGSMNHIEIWPRALPNYCASIPVIIKDLWWPKLLGFDCPRLYCKNSRNTY